MLEQIAATFGFPQGRELQGGRELLDRILSRNPLVLHGHKHVPQAANYNGLSVYNAGSSTKLMRFRVFKHEAGKLVDVRWQDTDLS